MLSIDAIKNEALASAKDRIPPQWAQLSRFSQGIIAKQDEKNQEDARKVGVNLGASKIRKMERDVKGIVNPRINPLKSPINFLIDFFPGGASTNKQLNSKLSSINNPNSDKDFEANALTRLKFYDSLLGDLNKRVPNKGFMKIEKYLNKVEGTKYYNETVDGLNSFLDYVANNMVETKQSGFVVKENDIGRKTHFYKSMLKESFYNELKSIKGRFSSDTGDLRHLAQAPKLKQALEKIDKILQSDPAAKANQRAKLKRQQTHRTPRNNIGNFNRGGSQARNNAANLSRRPARV
jgi:hypothetical protein